MPCDGPDIFLAELHHESARHFTKAEQGSGQSERNSRAAIQRVGQMIMITIKHRIGCCLETNLLVNSADWQMFMITMNEWGDVLILMYYV